MIQKYESRNRTQMVYILYDKNKTRINFSSQNGHIKTQKKIQMYNLWQN